MNSLVEGFEKQVRNNGNETALADRFGKRRTSYRELDELRRRAATKLLETGLSIGTPILINMGRCREYVAAYLAVEMVGCAAVPLTAEYPPERVERIREDCHAGWMITENFFDDIDRYKPCEDNELPETDDDTPAHITYTSGSTGKPKGILHTLRSLNRIITEECGLYDIGEKVIFAAVGNFSFIIFLYEVMRPLTMGAEVHLISDSMRKNPKLLAPYFLEQKINMSALTPQILKNFHNQSPYLRRVFSGSEQISNLYAADYEILSIYGSSEMGMVSSFLIDRKYRNTPIGKPFPGCTFVLLADKEANAETAGTDAAEGELCVIGDVAKEYLNLPEKSRQTFEKRADGTILYHTGDYVCRGEDGNYTLLNRVDWMVKINGQRVETLEVENVLKELPRVDNAAVKAFEDADGQKYLCAYYVEKGEADERNEQSEAGEKGEASGDGESGENTERVIRGELRKKLPAYMVPRFFVRMDALPLNGNNKLDRIALQPPSVNDYKTAYCAPRSEREKAVCLAFSEVLHCGTVGIRDDFFSLGGDSIKVLKLAAELEKNGYTLSPDAVLSGRTPERIAERFRASEDAKILHLDTIPQTIPLTDSQRGVYLECMENPETTMYNIPFALLLPEETDTERFADAVEIAAKRHPALFAAVGTDGDAPVMRTGVYDCTIVRGHAESAEQAKRDFVKPFRLEQEPLYRFALCETPDGILFLFDVHHLVFDGTSVRIFLDGIAAAYEGRALSAERLTLFDVAENEKMLKTRPCYQEAQTYFDAKFGGTDFQAELIPDVDSTKTPAGSGMVTVRADETLSASVAADFAGKLGITESTLFMAAFAYAMSVFTGEKETCFTTVNSGRHTEQLSDTVGMFVRTLPLHFEIPENGEIAVFLRGVQEIFYQTMRHDCISFGELVQKYGIHADISFVYQSELLSKIELDGKKVMPEELPIYECQSDILCMVLKTENGYELRMHYRSNRYSEGFVKSLAETVAETACAFLHCNTLDEIDAAGAESRELADSVNCTEKPYDLSETPASVIRDVIAAFPEKTALVYRERSYTYGEFDRITRRIAAYLVNKGIGAEDFVAVLTPRNDEGVLAAWGAVRAGAAFQMLDPTYPAERLNYMILDSQAKLLIADRTLAPVLTQYQGELLYADEIFCLPEISGVLPAAKPENAVTLIYTSGTTGKPKGCVLENRNLAAFYQNHRTVAELDADARVAAYASFGFDAGVMDLVGTLMAGACLYIVPDEIRLDIAKLDAFFCQNSITFGMMTTQVGRTFAEETTCKTLRAFMVGGEKLVPFTPQKGFRFINAYGPCETMAYICHYEVRDNSLVQPIGKPEGNTKLYVLDGKNRQVPTGALGELAIAGRQVGRGYLGKPEKTAEVFVRNPFTTALGYDRIYKTGDVVRMLPDGNLEFIGRRDGQVKIRGFRVELTEIEEVIRRFAGVRDATVAAFEKPSGGKYIAAYIVSADKIDTEKLNAFIRAEKPAYMVPAVTMQIEKIPYNQNQKVNKRALPMPKFENQDDTKPENELQRKIYDIAAEVLGHTDFGIRTDLFEAGLTSIGTLKLNLMLGKAFRAAVKLSDIKSHATVSLLAEFLAGMDGKREEAVDTKAADYPLMQNQLGVLLECGIDRETVRYNIPLLIRLSEKTDAKRLCKAVCTAINAHPYLKATLKNDAQGNFHAVRNDAAEPCVDYIRLAALPSVEELIRPFTLLGGRLYRAAIYETDTDSYFFMDVHHVAADGTSIAVFLRDVDAAYAGKTLETEDYTAFEAAQEEEQALASEAYTQAEAYYKALLSDADTACMPEKCPETDAKEDDCASCTFTLGDCSEAVTVWCAENHLTANAFFNAVFSYTLAEFLHTDNVTYCTVYNGRNDSRMAECFAMLVKTLPVHCNLNTKNIVKDYTTAVQKQLLDTMANDLVPFAKLSNQYGLKSDIFFNYQGDTFTFDTLGGESAQMMPLTPSAAKAPLSVEIFLENGVYRVQVTYRPAYFCREFIDSFADGIMTATGDFTRAETLAEVSVFSEAEKRHFDEMNATETPFEPIPVQRLFERCAAETPEKLAVKTAKDVLTYGELDARANILANALLKLGAGNGEIVGLILERSAWVPVSEIGILKAGCAFLPMLPTYPDDRLEYCLRDAGCRFVLSEGKTITEKPALFAPDKPFRAIAVEELLAEDDAAEHTDLPQIEIAQNQPAYCIYTSGSTGKPKGVLIEQHNISDFVQTIDFAKLIAKGNTVLCMSSISFDMSLSEILFSICHGKTIYIATEEEIHNLDLLLKAFLEQHIDWMFMTPSFAWNLLSMPEFEGAMAQLQGVLLGAEAFQPTLLGKFKTLNPEMVVQNGYGPTECTQACSVKTLEKGEAITIGGPAANMKFYVCDVNGNLLPRYANGELMICGENVCRGYVNLPEKNKAAFTEINGLRAYHSGDLVRINRDNEAEFGGRADNQVKLRGFRVELDEVENIMQSYPGVVRCKVIVCNNGTEDYLAGYFTAEKPIEIEELTAFMKTKLTYYMVPAAMMQLEKMPMTQNGKLDKKALPEIRPVRRERERRVPKKSLEEKILELFGKVLNIGECYVDDSFFEIGGTSLSASKVVMQLKAAGYKIEYQDIFDHQTAEQLAAYLESETQPVAAAADKGQNAKQEPAFVRQDAAITEILRYNTMEYAEETKREPLGDILLTGASGFLGIHVLKEILENETGRVTCLLRKGIYVDVVTRLKSTLFYYFEDDFASEFGKRLFVAEGDITDSNLSECLRDVHFDTLINCAASVRHFAKDNSIEFVNVHGVENLIALTQEKQAKMIQISTTSIPGAHNDETYRVNLRMAENELFVIDDMGNQYIQSKYRAELKMFAAMQAGMRGKIIRVGNLMGRHSDGEFQVNMHTNAFLNALKGFVSLGKCPISHATDPMKVSPIDCTAKAVVLLAGTNDTFTAFHADSRCVFDEMKFMDVINRLGIPIKPVPDAEYYADFNKMMSDEKKNAAVSALLTNDRPDVHLVETENRFTANVLYRLGFSWPFVDDVYLSKIIRSLATLGFFSKEAPQ